MQRASRPRGFTLIELLTVIAIIAILAAILFPVAATVREQARASDCMSKMHQLWVAANVYRSDEGAFPPALYGYPEYQAVNAVSGQCDPKLSSGVPYGTDASQPCAAQPPVSADRIINGFLYPEQTKDSNLVKCADNVFTSNVVPQNGIYTVAHYTTTPPPQWPVNITWIGKVLADYGCPTDAYGTVDCFVGGPYDKMAKFYYTWDSYDIGPAVDAKNNSIILGGTQIFDKHYSPDWSGVRGANDLPNQLKYSNPPDDKTLLTYCTWHARTGRTGSVPVISMSGTAKKLSLQQILDFGPNVFNK